MADVSIASEFAVYDAAITFELAGGRSVLFAAEESIASAVVFTDNPGEIRIFHRELKLRSRLGAAA